MCPWLFSYTNLNPFSFQCTVFGALVSKIVDPPLPINTLHSATNTKNAVLTPDAALPPDVALPPGAVLHLMLCMLHLILCCSLLLSCPPPPPPPPPRHCAIPKQILSVLYCLLMLPAPWYCTTDSITMCCPLVFSFHLMQHYLLLLPWRCTVSLILHCPLTLLNCLVCSPYPRVFHTCRTCNYLCGFTSSQIIVLWTDRLPTQNKFIGSHGTVLFTVKQLFSDILAYRTICLNCS